VDNSERGWTSLLLRTPLMALRTGFEVAQVGH
jgi:hypothetical protein